MKHTAPSGEKTDVEIRRSVLRELREDTRIDETAIEVAVRNGVVVLTGTVGSYFEKVAAHEAPCRILAVRGVANGIEVHIPGRSARSDAEIARDVERALERDTLVPHEHVRCSVADGMVTLEGDVPGCFHRHNALRAVRGVHGVRGVVNQIEIAPPTEPDEVRHAIEGALERRAAREAGHIRVEVRDDIVTLIGEVSSRQEKRAVLGAAGQAPGIRHVEDRLRIALDVPEPGYGKLVASLLRSPAVPGEARQ